MGNIMKAKIIRNDHGLAICVSKDFIVESGLSVSSEIELVQNENDLLIYFHAPKYTIEELCAGITPDNQHKELYWGPDVGDEIIHDDHS